ncbi:hypothetical protein PIROE2DRAFT_16224 [Piromyces sp. E2]|nr:hypothetical protein PIROE2DRAFT_16224 [Piromyces sp. E2]|eukprot:OUM58482.1 hypothetical protein PIROE2DRAFT_16224 [Piromyces sp. E2]
MKRISFFFGFVMTLLLGLVLAKDEYMLVFVPTEKSESVHDAIHDIIMKNKNTYEDMTKFENLQKDFDKDKDKFALDYGNSAYVYPISSVSGSTVLLAYLSTELIKKVESLPDVKSVEEDAKAKIDDPVINNNNKGKITTISSTTTKSESNATTTSASETKKVASSTTVSAASVSNNVNTANNSTNLATSVSNNVNTANNSTNPAASSVTPIKNSNSSDASASTVLKITNVLFAICAIYLFI